MVIEASPATGTSSRPAFTFGRRPGQEVAVIAVFVAVPMLALVLAVPVAWGAGLGWTDVLLAVFFYCLSGLGVTVGFHRYLTHGGFRAGRPLRIALAVAGSAAMQGSVIAWVADHRRHHAYADRDGDPHSPWRYGTGPGGVARGLLHAHIGWLFTDGRTDRVRYAPDLMRDRDLVAIDRLFLPISLATLLLPAVLGGLLTWSWAGALTAFFWAGLVRVAVLHHVTWSVNSLCHVVGRRPFAARDRSTNFWPLAVLSFGESWHNGHHADPTCARHGVLRGQVDISARLIRVFQLLGWARNVRWPTPERLARNLGGKPPP
jgi:stearoyl-CoA desaturase (Delta-9 desaturase)